MSIQEKVLKELRMRLSNLVTGKQNSSYFFAELLVANREKLKESNFCFDITKR